MSTLLWAVQRVIPGSPQVPIFLWLSALALTIGPLGWAMFASPDGPYSV